MYKHKTPTFYNDLRAPFKTRGGVSPMKNLGAGIGQLIASGGANRRAKKEQGLADAEYASGIITQQDSTMKISYAWVNSNESEFLSIALFDDIAKVALFRPFFGQAYEVDNNDFFVGTILTGFELSQDTNGNSVLDQAEELKRLDILDSTSIIDIRR